MAGKLIDIDGITAKYLDRKDNLQPIYINLKNNTSLPQSPTLFQTTPDQSNPIQLKTLFTYDMTIYINNNVDILYVYYSINYGAFQLATYTPGGQIVSINDIIGWLNSLNIGVFSVLSGNIVVYYSATNRISVIQGGNSVIPTSAVSDVSYNTNGTLLYIAGYGLNGVGNFTLLPNNPLWQNSAPNTTDGRFNNAGTFFATGNAGLGTCTMPFASTGNQVYIGLSFINYVNPIEFNVYVNNNLVLALDATAVAAMNANIDTILGGSYSDVLSTFWHVFPININTAIGSQNNVITIEGGATHSNNINLGFEIYDNTAIQLTAATTPSDLNILNSALANGYIIAKF